MTGLVDALVQGLDPVALARLVGLEPDPWQVRLLRSQSSRLLVNCARQSGKTTTAALLAVHQALFRPGSTTVLVSPTQRQSGELFSIAAGIYRRLGRPIAPERDNLLSLVLENGSRIISLPGSETGVRGYTADLVVLDEASRIEDSLYTAVRPMVVVSRGRLIAMSTPFGSRGWWFGAWRGEELWERYEVPATANPRISEADLEAERVALGDWLFEQEYECVFGANALGVFDPEVIARSINPGLEEWDDL